MRYKTTPALVAIGGLLLVAWSCNIQPGGSGGPQAEPDPGPPPMTALQAERGFEKRQRNNKVNRKRMKPIQPVKLTGPKESKPAPLPKADKVLAIFHSGNVDGEVDPCG